jgi:hypothetical protein
VPSPDHQSKFSWQGYAVVAAMILACVGGTEYYQYRKTGKFDLAFSILMTVFFLTYSAQGWWRMRKQIRDGTFSNDAYNADPIGYMRGPLRRTVLFVLALVAATFVVVLYRVSQ